MKNHVKMAGLTSQCAQNKSNKVVSYIKPITLKFTINPKIPVLHFVNTIPTKFQSKILSFGVMHSCILGVNNWARDFCTIS